MAHPLGGVVHGKCVHVEVVVDDDVEAVCGEVADKVYEARIYIGVWKLLIAVARPLRVTRRLQRVTKHIEDTACKLAHMQLVVPPT